MFIHEMFKPVSFARAAKLTRTFRCMLGPGELWIITNHRADRAVVTVGHERRLYDLFDIAVDHLVPIPAHYPSDVHGVHSTCDELETRSH